MPEVHNLNQEETSDESGGCSIELMVCNPINIRSTETRTDNSSRCKEARETGQQNAWDKEKPVKDIIGTGVRLEYRL